MARQNASVKRFQRVMASLPKEVEARALQILSDQAESLAAQMRAAAPVGTGALRASIKVSKGKRPLSFYVQAGGRATTPGLNTFSGAFRDALAKSPRGRAAGLGAQGLYDYARAVEFGAAGRPPEPFFFPTYRRNRKAMKRYLAEQCAAALKKGFDNA